MRCSDRTLYSCYSCIFCKAKICKEFIEPYKNHISPNLASVEPSAPQPSPPMPSIRLRTCETWGFLPLRLLRSAILTPCGQGLRSFRLHYAHSAPKSPRLTGGPQNYSGVRSAHEPTGNLQDCPDHIARHIYRHRITSGLQDTYQEPFPQAISSKTHPLPHSLTSHQQTHTYTPSHGRFPCISTKGSQQFPAVSSFMTAPLRSMPSDSRHLHNIIRA